MLEYECYDCPRECGAHRSSTGNGYCRMGALPTLARAALHFDEEPVISGTAGSGAVFFSGCSLGCRFCQNYEVSHHGFGEAVSIERLRGIYFDLIGQGALNINLVNPTHFLRAVLLSLKEPLPVPVIWNSGGYDSVSSLRRLEGRIQVYLPDLKYVSSDLSGRFSMARDYFDVASSALAEMYRQVGEVELDERGVIRKGLIVRHLILPGCVDDSKRVLDWIAQNLPGAWISLMAQYLPFGDVKGVGQLERTLTPEEYEAVFEHLSDLGIENGFVQELSSSDEKYIPKFDLTGVRDGRSD